MKSKSVIKSLHVTEKASTLQSLAETESNRSIKAFNQAKYVFEVHQHANKIEIRYAIEEMYKVKVEKVNTINLPPKKKRVKGSRRMGTTSKVRKAIVTLKEGEEIEFEA